MYQTIPTHISKDINTDTIEILKQIKKQSDEISTSEGSIHFFKNLSNPTNLTNPQIIGSQKTSSTNTQSPTFTKKDVRKIKKRNFYKVKSNINLIKNDLFNHQKFPHNLFIKEHTKKIISKKITNDTSEGKGLCKTTKGKVKLEPIWDKLKIKSMTHGRQKDIRINVRKNALVKNFIDSSKRISQIKYNIDIKKEKYQQMKNLKENQIFIINKTEEKISNLQNIVLDDYKSNYIQYLKFLNNTIEKESLNLYDLSKNIIILTNDINKLNKKLSALIETKCHILKWIELQIKLKEKIKTIPKYYFDILEENDNYKVYKFSKKINKSRIFLISNFSSLNTNEDNETLESQNQELTISEPDRERILNYRYNLIFKSPEEFMSQYSKFESLWLENIDKQHDLIKEIDLLKKKFSEFDDSNFADDEKLLLEKLRLNKNIYFQLKYQYETLKGLNKKIIKKVHIGNVHQTKSTLSSPDIYSNIYDEMFNNLNFYNVKTTSIHKKSFSSLNKFSDIMNTNLYKLIIDLFNLVSQNNFLKFDKSNLIKNGNTNKIFEIMNYIESVINLLFEEKYKYLNDPKLKEKYKLVQADITKENKRIKLLKLIKITELKKKMKLNAMNNKGIKRQYFSSRKIDYSLYKKLMIIKNKNSKEKEINKQKEEKYEPNLEDFLYDIK